MEIQYHAECAGYLEEDHAMRLPAMIAQQIQAGHSLGFACDSTGNVREWPSSHGVYPPVGYLRWRVLEVGNGDSYGYYWPVGREDHDPIVCTTEHDRFRLVPFASDLAGCLRLLRATRTAVFDEIKEVAQDFAVPLTAMQPSDAASPERALATLDPHSPQLLLEQARAAMRIADLTLCERSLLEALDLCPEYGEAAAALGQLYRRQQRSADAAQALLVAISTPLCFGAGDEVRLKCLRALQGMKGDLISADDVLWRERGRLTLRTGVRENDDLRIYEDAIAAYVASGAGTRAVWLRMLVGELMSRETVSFQERYGWTRAKHRQDLAHDLLAAGLSARISALGPTSA
jgi:hypothetical protein